MKFTFIIFLLNFFIMKLTSIMKWRYAPDTSSGSPYLKRQLLSKIRYQMKTDELSELGRCRRRCYEKCRGWRGSSRG